MAPGLGLGMAKAAASGSLARMRSQISRYLMTVFSVPGEVEADEHGHAGGDVRGFDEVMGTPPGGEVDAEGREGCGEEKDGQDGAEGGVVTDPFAVLLVGEMGYIFHSNHLASC